MGKLTLCLAAGDLEGGAHVVEFSEESVPLVSDVTRAHFNVEDRGSRCGEGADVLVLLGALPLLELFLFLFFC